MFLKRIELQGFKSFADKTVLQFDHDITGIVGPNGCGKSNVTDAIRWVLGEQSVKSLRSGSSMSDIIFSGSALRKAVNLARVSLVFDNTKRIFDSDYDEIEVTRQLARANNEASYFINKQPCRLKDIQELILDTGLGRDSLSIITQGNISSFADAKPEERRLLFEEAAGVAKYKKRKQVSLAKLAKSEENLERLADIMEELDKQVEVLERQAKKARKYQDLSQQLSSLEVSWLVHEIETKSESLKELANQETELKAFQTSNEIRLNEFEQEAKDIRNRLLLLDRDLATLQAELGQAMSENLNLEKRKIELDQKRKYQLEQGNREQLAQQAAEAKFDYENRLARYQALEDQLKTLLASQTDSTGQKQVVDQKIQQLSNQLTSVQQRLTVLSTLIKNPFAHQPAIKAVLDAKLRGVEGVVSTLLNAQPSYEAAIEAALGGANLQIVTEDESAARQAIAYLKQNRAGRATFLPLSVCHPQELSSTQLGVAEKLSGFVCVASQAVDCEAKYDVLKSRLLGRVLIAQDLVSAGQIARDLNFRFKVVTLDGDIVHSGGSMTGGSRRQQANLATSKQEAERLNEQQQQLKASLQLQFDEAKRLDQKLASMASQAVSYQVELGKLENLVAIKKAKYEQLADHLSDQTTLEDDLVVQLADMHARLDQLEAKLNERRQERNQLSASLEQVDLQLSDCRRQQASCVNRLHENQVQQTRQQTMVDTHLDRLNADYSMTFEYAKSIAQDLDWATVSDEVAILKESIKKLGNVNLEAPTQYEEAHERLTTYQEQKAQLESASEQLKQAIAQMDDTMKTQFLAMFNRINDELQEVFKAMFGGGKATLSLVDPEDVINTGIEIDVQPPGKWIKNISTFSGGEKALIAISVLFSILKARIMPLCIFDEVEAALDQANVERFARYFNQFRDQSQFVVVTHRPGTMEQCDTLFGVTMKQDGVSQVLKVELQDAKQLASQEDHGNL